MNLTRHQENIFHVISDLDPQYIAEAQSAPRRKHVRLYKYIGVAAASLILVAVLLGIPYFFAPENPASYFIITASAENGVLTELGLNEGVRNSAESNINQNMFDVDMPLFEFRLRPSERYRMQTYYDLDVAVSYDETLVDPGEEHIAVAHLFPVPGSGGIFEYYITGWFTEPTDITISVTNRKSGEVLEVIAVNVNYIADARVYQLTVIDTNTAIGN